MAAGSAAGANADSIAAQKAQADRMYYMGMPAYGKEGKTGMWSLLRPELASWISGKRPEVMSSDLTDAQYQMMIRPITESYQKGRGQVEQGMTNRGLDYGNLMPKALGEYDQRYQTTLGDIGTKVAANAAQMNFGAQQSTLDRLLGAYMGLFKQGQGEKTAWMGQGMQGQSNAISAGAANTGNYWNSMAGAFGNAMGSIPWGSMGTGGTGDGMSGVSGMGSGMTGIGGGAMGW